MEELNVFQKKFFEELKNIQEEKILILYNHDMRDLVQYGKIGLQARR